MNKVLYIIIISLFSLTGISCSNKDNSSSSSSSTDNLDTSTSDNFCQQANYISSVSHLTSDTVSRSSNRMDKVLYVDRKELSNYSADPYLSFDIFKGFQFEGDKEDRDNKSFEKHEQNEFDRIDLSESAPSLSATFT